MFDVVIGGRTIYEFKEFDMGLPYIPHMTIGKLPEVQLLNEAYDDVKAMNDVFHTVVDKISVEMIGENEESLVIIEKKCFIKKY